MDLPPHLRYNTSMKEEFVDHQKRAHLVETTAQIVGVDKGETCFKKVSHYFVLSSNCFIIFIQPVQPTSIHAFYGASVPEETRKEEENHLKKQEEYI